MPPYHFWVRGVEAPSGGSVKTKSILLVVAAFLLGAVAAGSIGVRVIREVRTDDEATSLPPASTTTVPAAEVITYQVDPAETVIGSTALVPTALEVSGTRLAIAYDLVTLAPYAGVEGVATFVPGSGLSVIEIPALNHVYPRAWRLETARGSVEGGPANSDTRIARFDVGDGFSISEIREVVITEARTPLVTEIPFTVSDTAPTVEVLPGVEVRLLNVSDQGSTTIVQVAVDAEDPDLASAFVRGDGPGWRSAVLEAEGRPRINLTYVGERLPDPIPLVATATAWIELAGSYVVDVEELR